MDGVAIETRLAPLAARSCGVVDAEKAASVERVATSGNADVDVTVTLARAARTARQHWVAMVIDCASVARITCQSATNTWRE